VSEAWRALLLRCVMQPFMRVYLDDNVVVRALSGVLEAARPPRFATGHMSNNTAPHPGLCATCHYMERTETRRGSVFYRCLRAQTDLSFARYPPLPVWQCHGYQPQATEDAQDVSSP
jgi:hypothetical protein